MAYRGVYEQYKKKSYKEWLNLVLKGGGVDPKSENHIREVKNKKIKTFGWT